MTRTPKATVRLNAWELLAIETALKEVKGFDTGSKAALIEKISNAKPK